MHARNCAKQNRARRSRLGFISAVITGSRKPYVSFKVKNKDVDVVGNPRGK